LISATTTKTGLQVDSALHTRGYLEEHQARQSRDEKFNAVRLFRHELDPPFSWNVKPTAILKALSMGYGSVIWTN
jgi:hypothetical protein